MIQTQARRIVQYLTPYSERINIAGSIRRKEPARDIDIVLIPKDKTRVIDAITRHGGKIYAKGGEQVFFKTDHTDVNIYFTTPNSWGATLMTRTGPKWGNVGNRTLARSKGMLLNQYGLYKNDRKIAGSTEKEIYEALGKSYKPPSQRGR